jgi:hypothetical protein
VHIRNSAHSAVNYTPMTGLYSPESPRVAFTESVERVKLAHCLYSEIQEYNEALNDWLKPLPAKLLERYLRRHLAVALVFFVEIDGCGSLYSALITKVSTDNISRPLSRGATTNQQHLSMFVCDVEAVNDVQERIDRVRSIVRLKQFDKHQRAGITDTLYLSTVTGKSIFLPWGCIEDWKLDELSFFGISVPFTGKQPYDVIEAGTKMMDSLASNHAEAKGNLTPSVIVNCLKEKLLVVLGQDGIFATLKKPFDFRIQIEDILLGPI